MKIVVAPFVWYSKQRKHSQSQKEMRAQQNGLDFIDIRRCLCHPLYLKLGFGLLPSVSVDPEVVALGAYGFPPVSFPTFQNVFIDRQFLDVVFGIQTLSHRSCW